MKTKKVLWIRKQKFKTSFFEFLSYRKAPNNRHFGERPADTAAEVFIYIEVNEALNMCSPTNAETINSFLKKKIILKYDWNLDTFLL